MTKAKLFAVLCTFISIAGWSDTFDCRKPSQRLSCSEPNDPGKRYVCRATGSDKNPFVRISVSRNAAVHDGDQSPGASADDVGSGPGLDCDCQPRVCDDVCTGAIDGVSCDDADLCTRDGQCSGGVCQSGAPVCSAGTAVDFCNVQTGACDATNGDCLTTPRPAGTPCGPDDACNDNGLCVPLPHIVLNEIESSGGVPGDWVELFNAGHGAVDVSGWKFLDNDNAHTPYVIPSGTVIPVGGFLVLEEAQFGFGLGAADSARLFNASGALVDSYSWTSHALTTYGRCPNGTGTFQTTTFVTKGAANDCGIAVRINEVESSGGSPGDWVELFNAGGVATDMSGWIFKDNDDTHAYVIPAGTTIAPGAYYLLEEAAFGFGLGSADSTRLFDTQGNVVDSYSWTTHATTTYGRCPNGSGLFATTASSTKGTANDCGAAQPPTGQPWPGSANVSTVDDANTFGQNLSDLFYEPGAPNVLWAVRNGPSTLFRLVWNGSTWAPDSAKTLRYPNGLGSPDSEGVTRAELGSSSIYVATERDNDVSGVSRLSVLRFDTNAPGAELIANQEWDLTSNILPAVGSNVGLEAITWVPDSYLVANAFFDEAAGHAYSPAQYASHGSGLFFVGLEATGTIYAYALNHTDNTFTRVATIASGNPAVMALYFDRETGYLWSQCDDSCGNKANVLAIDATGRFKLLQQFQRPTGMPNINNEGIAIAPEAECVAGLKGFWWADDSESGGHALRAGSVRCGRFIP